MFHRKSNVAKSASIGASSTLCKYGDCYDKKNMVDDDRNEELGSRNSWVSDNRGDTWVSFSWAKGLEDLEQVYFIGTAGYEPDQYKISVRTDRGWQIVADVAGNSELKICHRFPATKVYTVKIEGSGPSHEPLKLRLNEVVIR